MILFSVIYGAPLPAGQYPYDDSPETPAGVRGLLSRYAETDGAKRAVEALTPVLAAAGRFYAVDEARDAVTPGFYDHAGRFVGFGVPVPLDLPTLRLGGLPLALSDVTRDLRERFDAFRAWAATVGVVVDAGDFYLLPHDE